MDECPFIINPAHAPHLKRPALMSAGSSVRRPTSPTAAAAAAAATASTGDHGRNTPPTTCRTRRAKAFGSCLIRAERGTRTPQSGERHEDPRRRQPFGSCLIRGPGSGDRPENLPQEQRAGPDHKLRGRRAVRVGFPAAADDSAGPAKGNA